MKLKEEKREIEAKEKQSKADTKRLSAIEKEMRPFETFINDARAHREEIKKEIGIRCCSSFVSFLHTDTLLDDKEKCVLIVDFTKFGIVDDGNVHCFIVTLLYGEPVEKGEVFNLGWNYINCQGEIREGLPSIKYFDFYAQSRDEQPVRQVFPFVKVCSFHLN